MRFSSVKLFACLCLALWAGCRYVDVDKCADGSWHAKYYSYGLWTTLGSLEVNVTTNGIAHLKMSDLGSDVSTNHVTIVDASGKIVAEITGEVVEHLVKLRSPLIVTGICAILYSREETVGEVGLRRKGDSDGTYS